MDAYGILRAAEAERKGIEERWAKADEQHKQETETLQARIRALEAQAAADAVVAIAVERWVGALGFVANTGQSDWGPLADAFKDVCNAVNERRSALSARKGE
jgi:predicted ATPase